MENAELLQSIYDTAADAIITTDADGTILSCNNSTGRIFGFPEKEMIGMKISSLIPEKNRDEYKKILNDYLNSRNEDLTKTGKRLSARKGNGVIFPVSLTLSVISLKNKKTFIAIVRDITSITHIEESLVEHAKNLERSNRELEQFAYVASHDLQAPVRVIAHHAESVLKRAQASLDPKSIDSLQFISKTSKKLQALIQDLLLISRVDTQPQVLRLVSTEKLVDDVLRNLEVNLTESQATITRPTPLPDVQADEGQLTQLFQNLIANAIKFRKQDLPPKIEISANNETGRWIFCVEDNGIGISPEHFENIFGIFYRLHGKSEYPGSGIGLSLCKRIIERHGGEIWVKSTLGEGTRFFFTLSKIN